MRGRSRWAGPANTHGPRRRGETNHRDRETRFPPAPILGSQLLRTLPSFRGVRGVRDDPWALQGVLSPGDLSKRHGRGDARERCVSSSGAVKCHAVPGTRALPAANSERRSHTSCNSIAHDQQGTPEVRRRGECESSVDCNLYAAADEA